MKGKKILCAGLMAALAAGSAACGTPPQQAAVENVGKNVSILNTAGDFPIVNEPITIKALVARHRLTEDLSTAKMWVDYAEKTNIHIEMEQIPQENFVEKRNLVMASDDLPDVIFNNRFTCAEEHLYGSMGLLVPLNDLVDTYAPNYKAALENNPYVLDYLADDNGTYYDMAHIPAPAEFKTTITQMFVYTPWMEKLGLEKPTNTQEFYDMLKAFKEQDPNGNGIADEIPLSGSIDGYGGNPIPYIMSAFQKVGVGESLILDNGEIVYPYATDGYREGLRYMKKLYDEGLLSPQTFTQTKDQMIALAMNDTHILGATSGAWTGSFTIDGDPDDERYAQFELIEPLEGPTGLKGMAEFAPSPTTRMVITKACEYPEAMVRWQDYLYTEEGYVYSSFGIENEDWVPNTDPNLTNVNGKVATIQSLDPSNTNLGFSGQVGVLVGSSTVGSNAYPATQIQHNIAFAEEQKTLYAPYLENIDLPPVNFTTEENQEVEQIKAALRTHVNSCTAQFISGALDIEADWDRYVADLKTKGLDKFIEMHKEAYERKYK